MVLEGGIRVPYMVQWKGRIPAGKVYDQPVISLDIHLTAVAAAGGSIPASAKLDGVNLLPHLAGEAAGQPHEALFWRFGPQGAVRKGNWKIDMLAGAAPQLFNLAEDIGEARNLASAQPEKLKELKAAYDAWNAQLAEPRWQTRREGKKADARKKKR
jgi:arylsulfatase A-like enzyme